MIGRIQPRRAQYKNFLVADEPIYHVNLPTTLIHLFLGSQAVRMVHKYIQKIKVDRFTRLTPVWEDEFVEGSIQDNLFAGLGTSSNAGYQVRMFNTENRKM